MYLDVFGRQWKGPFPFSFENIQNVDSDLKGVYMLMLGTRPEELQAAYIGIATQNNSIRARLLKHFRGSHNWAIARIREPQRYSFVFFSCDDLTAHQIEGFIYRNHKPPFNVRPESVYFEYNGQWYCVSSITVH
jgi:hypothetical protein